MGYWFNPAQWSAGFVAVLVGYSSSAVIVFQAATVVGASSAEISSWFWALGIGMGMTCIGFSLYYRNPVMMAWSTPGAALLVTGLSGVSLSDALGAFLFCAGLTTLCGVTGWFDTLIKRLPTTIAAAMLAGVLVKFGLDLFIHLPTEPLLIGTMLMVYLLARKLTPRYVIPLVLVAGLSVAEALDLLVLTSLQLALARPIFTLPTFSLATLIGVGIPLFVVTMASQNVPGMAVLRANGYQTPASPLLTGTGLAGLILSPFGGFAFNLAAITAAICMGKEIHPDPEKRYPAAIWAGVFYLFMGVFGATVVGLFTAFPAALIAAIAGLALLGTIGNSLAVALGDESEREAALITFLVTASGLSLLSIGSAFWGLMLGLLTHALLQTAKK